MIIICKECETAYNLDDSLIGDSGSKVRCTKCRYEFVAYPHHETEEAGSDLETAGDPAPEADEDGLGLLGTEPIAVDFSDEAGIPDDEYTSEISGDAVEIEPELRPAEDELTMETDNDPAAQADGGLPAIEDLDDFDEALLADEEESPADESADPDAELLLEAERTEPVDTEADGPKEDTLDLSDIEDLVDSGEFQGAAGPDAQDGAPLLEPEENDGTDEIDFSGVEEESEKIDISDLEEILAEDSETEPEAPLFEEDGEPELVFEGLFETIEGEETADAADYSSLGTDGTESEPEIEIFFDPEDGFIDGGEPAPAEDVEPEILFEEPTPFESERAIFRPDDSNTGADAEGGAFASVGDGPEETAVLDGEATEVIDGPPKKMPAPAQAHSRKRSKLVPAAAAALMLAVAAVIVSATAGLRISDVTGMVKNIPFAGDFLVPAKADPAGNLRILPLEETVSGMFVDNSRAGKLFVIKGRVQNTYDHPRSQIKIIGKLYQTGDRLSKTARVYCGNILSASELEAMDMAVIRRRLGNYRGEKRSNLDVESGRSVPFMIVFNHLPGDLDEYSIEVASSSG